MNEERGTDMNQSDHAEAFSVQEAGSLVDMAVHEQRDQRIRISLTIVLAGVVSFVVIDSFTNQYIHSLLVAFINWVKENPSLGVFAVIWVYIIATVLFVPGSILTIGTGYAFGNAFESTAKAVVMASTVRASDHWTNANVVVHSSFLKISFLQGRIHWRNSGKHLRFLVGSISVSRLCPADGVAVQTVSGDRSGPREQRLEDHDFAATFATYTLHCTRLHVGSDKYILLGLFARIGGNSSGNDYVLFHGRNRVIDFLWRRQRNHQNSVTGSWCHLCPGRCPCGVLLFQNGAGHGKWGG